MSSGQIALKRMNNSTQADQREICSFLQELLWGQLSGDSQSWMEQKLHQLKSRPSRQSLYLLFATAPRYISKSPVIFSPEDIRHAQELREGWQPQGLSCLQVARILAVLSYPYQDQNDFMQLVEQLFTTAEMLELVALYRALPLYPYPESLKSRAAEGIRTNMTPVFDAVALRNPYPCDFLSQDAWNQMILKALFMERPLFQVWGIDQRSNSSLVKMISDFAHERWAAGRNTSPEMWRPIKGPHAELVLEDLRHLLTTDDPLQHAAAVLACGELNGAVRKSVLEGFEAIVAQVDQAGWNWNALGQHYWRLKDIPAN